MEKNKENLRAGFFVASGVLLFLATLFFLGLSDVFKRKASVRTGFTESVQGLSRGSAVKYRGVQIGTVSEILILVNQKLIQVDMEIEPRFFADRKFKMNKDDGLFGSFFKSEIVQKGLRARLELVGITGMKYIDFDYYAKPDLPYVTPNFVGGTTSIYIPPVASSLKDLTGSFTMALERISKVRFEEISSEMERALREISTLLADPSIKSAITRINDAAENLDKSSRAVSSVLSEPRLQGLAGLLEQNLRGIDELRKQISLQTDAARIPESTAAFRRAADAVSASRMEISNTLMKLNQTLSAITMLADYLSTDPSSLLNGKKKPGIAE